MLANKKISNIIRCFYIICLYKKSYFKKYDGLKNIIVSTFSNLGIYKILKILKFCKFEIFSINIYIHFYLDIYLFHKKKLSRYGPFIDLF